MKLIIALLLFCMIVSTTSQECHYSCKTCSGSAYTQCLSCFDGTKNPQYGASCETNEQAMLNQKGGVCISPAQSKANPLGIILIILGILAGVFIKSHFIFYFLLSIQILGLAGFVQTAFPSSISLILGAFQYLMMFSVMGQNAKGQDCKFMIRNMYRINDFLGTSNFKDNSSAIIAIVYALTIFLALGNIYRAFRKNTWTCIPDKLLQKVLVGLRTALLFITQEAIILIYIGIRFSDLSGGQITMIVFYCISLIYLIVDCNFHHLPFFKSVEIMNLTFIKRLILPATAILPYKFSYTLIVFLVGFNLIELIFLTKIQNLKPKHYIYLCLQLVCISLLGGFAIADLGSNNQTKSTAISIFTTISLLIYLLIFIIQMVLGIKSMFSDSKVSNEEDIWDVKKDFSDHKSSLRDQDTISDMKENENKNYADSKIVVEEFDREQNKQNVLDLDTNQKKEKKFRTKEK